MKKPSKQHQAEHANERTKRFSLPDAKLKLAKLHATLADGLSKSLCKDIVSERENMVKPNGKLDSSLNEESKQTILRAPTRGRKSIGTLMPSRDLISDIKPNLLMPLIENNKPPVIRDVSFVRFQFIIQSSHF